MNLSLNLSVKDFNSYVQYVNSFPSLSTEQELDLAFRVKDHNDHDAAKQLILHNLKHVVYVAKTYLGYNMPIEDLVQEGNVGLMKAVKNFDPTRGFRLITFAIYSIKSEIQQFVMNNWSLVKVASGKANKKLFFNLRSLNKSHDASMSSQDVEYIADQLSVSQSNVRDMEQRMYKRDFSLDFEGDDEDSPNFDYFLEDSRYEPSKMLEREQYESMLDHIDELDERTKDIIANRYLADKKATLHELARRYNVSAERIRQIEVEGIKKLREQINGV